MDIEKQVEEILQAKPKRTLLDRIVLPVLLLYATITLIAVIVAFGWITAILWYGTLLLMLGMCVKD